MTRFYVPVKFALQNLENRLNYTKIAKTCTRDTGPGPVSQLGPYNQAGSSSTGRRIELPSLKKTVNTYVH